MSESDKSGIEQMGRHDEFGPEDIADLLSDPERVELLTFLRKSISRRNFLILLGSASLLLAAHHFTKGLWLRWIWEAITNPGFRDRAINSLLSGKVEKDMAEILDSREIGIVKQIRIERTTALPEESVQRLFRETQVYTILSLATDSDLGDPTHDRQVVSKTSDYIHRINGHKGSFCMCMEIERACLEVNSLDDSSFPSTVQSSLGPSMFSFWMNGDQSSVFQDVDPRSGYREERREKREIPRPALVIDADNNVRVVDALDAMQYNPGDGTQALLSFTFSLSSDTSQEDLLELATIELDTGKKVINNRTFSSCYVTFFDQEGHARTMILSKYERPSRQQGIYFSSFTDESGCADHSLFSPLDLYAIAMELMKIEGYSRFILGFGDPVFSPILLPTNMTEENIEVLAEGGYPGILQLLSDFRRIKANEHRSPTIYRDFSSPSGLSVFQEGYVPRTSWQVVPYRETGSDM